MRPLILFAIYGVAFASVTIIRATADANNPAHDLAQKFAADGDVQPEAAKPVATNPVAAIPMGSRPMATRPVATKPVATRPMATKPSPAKAVIPMPAAATPAKAAPTLAQAKPPRPPAPGPDYERDMLDAARAEADAREKPQTQQAESTPPAAAPVPAPAAVTAPVQPSTPPEPAPAQAAAPPPAPAPSAPVQIKIEAKINVPAPAVPAAISRPEGAPRATILAVLTHHAHDAVRPVTPPDPIICLADVCYISAGPNADAKLISRTDALSTKNTVTAGAGACKGMNRCAFRGVSMKPGDEIQIVDLGLVDHDKREPADVTPDTSCRVDDGDLVCDQPVAAPDYRIWVVPETIAAAAGPGAIESALADDLPEEDIARAEDK